MEAILVYSMITVYANIEKVQFKLYDAERHLFSLMIGGSC